MNKHTNKHTFIKEIDPTVRGGKVCLIELNGTHYVISSIPNAPDHGGPETLAFKATSEGDVEDWTDLAGGVGKSREETIEQLETSGENPYGIADEVPMSAILGAVLSPPGREYYVDKDEV